MSKNIEKNNKKSIIIKELEKLTIKLRHKEVEKMAMKGVSHGR